MNSKPWSELPEYSRFWCFCAASPWSEGQDSLVEDHLDRICREWTAHGQPISAGYTTVDRRLIALAVDEQTHTASGCSIDTRMKALNELSRLLGIDLFGRMMLYVRSNATRTWEPVNVRQARQAEGEFLNTVAQSKGDWQPILPIEGSWLRPKTSA
ncbi:MAG: hypothetical protein P8N56_00315 [Schleiferiaceae bacterium]|nr:hypothetical protein [Schleiferiaceae bacterium]